MIQDRILKVSKIDWTLIQDIQPENVKSLVNRENVKQSIIDNGFAVPFAVWQDKDGQIYAIDGHTRKGILTELGKEVPKKLTAVFLDAKDRKEAIQILIEAYNLKSNPFKSVELESWLIEESIEMETIILEGVDITQTTTNSKKIMPQFGDNVVTQDSINKADEKLNSNFIKGERKIGVICPGCLHEFEIQ